MFIEDEDGSGVSMTDAIQYVDEKKCWLNVVYAAVGVLLWRCGIRQSALACGSFTALQLRFVRGIGAV